MNAAELLSARARAIELVVQQCGGESSKDPADAALHGTLVMLAREAAGAGFDEGVKWASQPSTLNSQPASA